MNNVYAVVEGKSEQAFLDRVLVPHLAEMSVWLHVALVGKPGRKGGVRPWELVRRDIVRFLRMDKPARPVYVTTMFDFFRMPANWPGRPEAAEQRAIADRAAHLERKLAGDVTDAMGERSDAGRFIAYVQMHELEALILAKPEKLELEFPNRQQEVASLVESIGDQDPEAVDDRPETAPSARITERIPEYAARKASAAPSVLEDIGLGRLRERCRHFSEWVRQLEALAGPS